MNLKKAKHLRRMVRRTHPDMVPTQYTEQQHKEKLVWNGKLNEDGTKVMVKVIPTTVILDNCQRGLYQKLKSFG